MPLRKSLIFLLLVPSIVHAGPGYDGLQAFLKHTDSMQASFEQALYNAEGVLMETSRGEMYLQRPARFRWDYQEPYPQLIVADGERIWTFDPELKQATVRPLKDVFAHTPGLLLGTGRPIEQDFELTEQGRSESLDWLYLTPKHEDSHFVSIRLGFDGSSLIEIQMHDSLDQLTRLRFIGQKHNPELDAALFIFEPSSDIDVISGGSQN